jgi:hypothetical protein
VSSVDGLDGAGAARLTEGVGRGWVRCGQCGASVEEGDRADAIEHVDASEPAQPRIRA